MMLAGKLMYSLMIIIVIINTVNGNCPDDEPPPPPSPIPEVPYVISGKFYSPSNTSVNDAPVCAMARDCKEWYYDLGATYDGIYTVKPDDGEPFQVYCESGWTVFQRRQDGSVDFYRGWIDYENGFGDLNGEFWLGLSKIHRLTKEGTHRLDIYLTYNSWYTDHVVYSSFNISDRDTEYIINLQYSYGSAYNLYGLSRTIDDSMTGRDSLNGMKFSTKDNDNDYHRGNCAEVHHGAWWYNSCSDSNLNGLYSATNETGIFWKDCEPETESIRSGTRMRIRRDS
ncbi:PREDICTED: angiopoietin-related protein 1-like [Amphimedon queenslandica]|uniref:Fibrinogen C-terminal domain-containing protein n=2 Tax=Amphimedon queenslandica TaxID=400682 RepID=A0AAN0II37_AMPQE|nr:PREDICTED: angiopoietin-related protein 1-like [Amphimedon queenslandica]|eukprot:XP_003390325.2 PREDICTED: angiopoietin-related protein 1-like [Amphimedon queenslandica]